ncbi:MAG: SRPBCC family protein [Burkholderiales bacterium]
MDKTVRFFLLFLFCTSAWAAPQVEVQHEGKAIHIEASLNVPVSVKVAWQVLTDYNHLADFIEDMRLSRVVSAAGEPLKVEQKGEGGLLVFRFPVEVVLAIEEQPQQTIRFQSVSGNVRNLSGEWRITPQAGSVNLSYSTRCTPDFWVPPLIGAYLMKNDVRNKMNNVAREMQRRAGL